MFVHHYTVLAFLLYLMPFNVLAEYEPMSAEEDDWSETAPPAVVIKAASDGLHSISGENYVYKIGPYDLLSIEVFMAKDLNHISRVNSKGFISMPLSGAIYVNQMTAEQVERLIEEKLGKDYLQDPHVSVFIKEYESQKITVNGTVRNPGVFPLRGKTTLLQAISMADGLVRLSDASEVVVFRKIPDKGTVGYKIDLERVQRGELPDPILQSEDIVVVPQDGSKAALDETRKTLQMFLGFLPFI